MSHIGDGYGVIRVTRECVWCFPQNDMFNSTIKKSPHAAGSESTENVAVSNSDAEKGSNWAAESQLASREAHMSSNGADSLVIVDRCPDESARSSKISLIDPASLGGRAAGAIASRELPLSLPTQE